MGIGGRPSRTDSSKDQVQVKITPNDSESPEIRKYKKRFTSDILCAALWGVNLLIGTEAGLMLLDRSGQGKGLRQHCTLAPLSLCGWSGLGLISKHVFTKLESRLCLWIRNCCICGIMAQYAKSNFNLKQFKHTDLALCSLLYH